MINIEKFKQYLDIKEEIEQLVSNEVREYIDVAVKHNPEQFIKYKIGRTELFKDTWMYEIDDHSVVVNAYESWYGGGYEEYYFNIPFKYFEDINLWIEFQKSENQRLKGEREVKEEKYKKDRINSLKNEIDRLSKKN